MSLSFQKIFFTIVILFALFAILILAKPILIPLSIALLLSFIMLPLANKFESWKINRILAAFLSIFTIVLIVGGVIFFFSTQIIQLSKEFSLFKEKIINVFAELTLYINKNVTFVPNLEKNEISDQIKAWFNESSGSLISKAFNSTTELLTGLIITIIFTFLILIYRKGLTNAFSKFFPENKTEKAIRMFIYIQQVGKKYLAGMILLILILGIINSLGLWIIGIDSPLLFGFLAAMMSIVPYVGTIVGASITVLYALLTYDSIWMAIAVAILFYCVQFTESYFLSPKIVGGSLKLNALAAILSIIIGAYVWGVIGMILFLPFVAMLKVICQEYVSLQPIALLIDSRIYYGEDDIEKPMPKLLEKIHTWFLKFNKKM